MKLTKKQWFILILNILYPLIVGFVSGRLAPNTQQIYTELTLPSYAPKSDIFPIVWGIIYLLSGIAAFLVTVSSDNSIKNENYYKNFEDYKKDKQKKIALIYYVVLILLSGLWTPVFFTLGQWKVAFVMVVIIVILSAIVAIKFYKVNKIAGLLLLPFVLWSAFASVLLYNIIRLN